MFRYLKAAFLFSPPVSFFGKLPLNVLMLAAFAIFGFVHPGFLLLGMGLEVAYLFSFATNRRCQRLIDSQDVHEELEDSDILRQSLRVRLKPASLTRLAEQEVKCMKIRQSYEDSTIPEFLKLENGKALDKLLRAHLRLLLNRDKIDSADNPTKAESLKQQIAEADSELQSTPLPDSVRNSKQSTLDILKKRLVNVFGREQMAKEIDSALIRIEAQLDLALDNSLMPDPQSAISADIEIASQLLDDNVYSDFGTELAEIENAGIAGSRARV
jgi:hypothetical protein